MSKKLTFTLKNIDVRTINKKYGLEKDATPIETTSIDDLYSNKNDFIYPYLDTSKRYYITMIDSMSKKEISSQHCFWCRHSFKTIPIGCPIRYIPNKIIKTITSELSNDTYSICQTMTENETKLNINDKIVRGYYETDGSFCSFNCCLAYIKDNIKNALYLHSEELLMKMYVECFDIEYSLLKKIHPAPSWKLLKEYGGILTIEEFRDSFQKLVYLDKNYIFNRPLRIHPVGRIFEEQLII
ncbi:MAG: hypothetical protein ACK518_01350 [bacterium]